jgi:hypothetical protein
MAVKQSGGGGVKEAVNRVRQRQTERQRDRKRQRETERQRELGQYKKDNGRSGLTLSMMLTIIPRSIKKETNFVWPPRAARCKPVCPACVQIIVGVFHSGGEELTAS